MWPHQKDRSTRGKKKKRGGGGVLAHSAVRQSNIVQVHAWRSGTVADQRFSTAASILKSWTSIYIACLEWRPNAGALPFPDYLPCYSRKSSISFEFLTSRALHCWQKTRVFPYLRINRSRKFLWLLPARACMWKESRSYGLFSQSGLGAVCL